MTKLFQKIMNKNDGIIEKTANLVKFVHNFQHLLACLNFLLSFLSCSSRLIIFRNIFV